MDRKWTNLKVVEKAHKLVLEIYRQSQSFPGIERYRLTDQLCRAASSVPANIVEGNSRKTKKEYVQFLYQAKGSLSETEYHLLLARDLGYLKEGVYKELVNRAEEVGKLISGLVKYLRSKN